MKNSLTIALLACLFAAGPCCADDAAAQITDAYDGLSDTPPADLVGWFLTFEPSNQWTSAANIATMESWLLAVEEIQNDAAALQQLNGLGMTTAQVTATSQALASNVQTQEDPASEPATLELLGGAFALFALGLFKRKGRRSRLTNRRPFLCLVMKD